MMAIKTFLYKLYLLLQGFDLVVTDIISQAVRQNGLIRACKNCNCITKQYKVAVSGLAEVKWSLLTIKCSGLAKFLEFASIERAMHYTGEPSSTIEKWTSKSLPLEIERIVKDMKLAKKEGRSYSNKEKKTFVIINVVINFPGTEWIDARLKTDCKNADKSKLFCLFDNENNILKYVTSLSVHGFTHVGVKGKPFLNIFPNLLSLKIINEARPAPKQMEIHFVKLNDLRNIMIHVKEKHVKLYCALATRAKCLSNPEGINQLKVELDLGGTLEVYGRWKLPTKISTLEILCYFFHHNPRTKNFNQETIQETEKKQTNIFKNVEFDNVRLRVCQLVRLFRLYRDAGYQSLEYINILQFAGSKIKKSVTIEGYVVAVNRFLPKVYELGWQDKLTISYDYLPFGSFRIPYTEIKKKIFDKSYFSNCNYGKKLLQHARSTIHALRVNNKKKIILIIRAFQITLSVIKNIIVEKKRCKTCNFKNVDIIRLYAFSIDIDIDPEKILNYNKNIEFYFMYAGSKKTSLLGTKTVSHSVIINDMRKSRQIKIKYTDLRIQFIDVSKTEISIPDPIVMRGFATCLLINLDSNYDDASIIPTETNPILSKWYKLIERSVLFDEKIYAKLDISRTETAYRHLKEYITWHYIKKDDVTKVPFLSLQVLSQNIRTLSDAMKDMIDKRRHLKTLNSFEKIETMQSATLKSTLMSISDTKIKILRASKCKSESLGDIELKKQTTLNKTMGEGEKFQNYLEKKFRNFEKLVRKETANFKKGVKQATALAIADAVAEAVGMILSVFSGGFNPAKAMKAARQVKKLKDIIKKLIKVMKTISDLLKRRKQMSDLWEKVKKSWAGRASRLGKFFKRQKSLLSAWWKNKAYVKTRLQTKDKMRFHKYMNQIRRKGQSYKRTADMVKSIVSFTKAERKIRIGFDPKTALTVTDLKHL